ncbi:hypothetical protein EGW08_009728, partial [Elysia chlorotica]
MDTTSPKPERPNSPASFKGQMAARYKERQSMGFHVTRCEKQGEHGFSEDSQRHDLLKAARVNTSGGGELSGQGANLWAEPSRQSVPSAIQGKPGGQSEEMEDGRSAVTTRRSMRDLITQFERRSNTALVSPERVLRPSPTLAGSARGVRAGMAHSAELADKGLAREAWRGSNRAVHMDLDTAAETSSSSSVSLSDESPDTDTCSLRRFKRCARRAQDGKYTKILRSASSTDLENGAYGASAGTGANKAPRKMGRDSFDVKGLELFAGKQKTGVSDSPHTLPCMGQVGDQANMDAPEEVDLRQKNTLMKDTESEFGQSEHRSQDAETVQTTGSELGSSEVPQPLRVNLKDFATRKKRSSNTGDMKYIVHRKDWNKLVQSQQGRGIRHKQSDGIIEVESKSLEPTKKSALELKLLRKKSSTGRSSDSAGFSVASSSRKRLSTSSSNSQQRLETRLPPRNLMSPGAHTMHVGRPAKPEVGLRKPSGAMERYQMFLNKTSRRGQGMKFQPTQHLPAESQSSQNSPSASAQDGQASVFGFSETEGSGPQASVTFPGFSLPPSTLSPRRRKEGSRQTLQALLKKARDKDIRQLPAQSSAENDEQGFFSMFLHKPDVSDGMTMSTGSFISNANTTSTMDLQLKMDRVLAQLEEVTAAKALKGNSLDGIEPRDTERSPLKNLGHSVQEPWAETSQLLSTLSPTGKFKNSVTREPNTLTSGVLRPDFQDHPDRASDSLLSHRGTTANKQPPSETGSVAKEYPHPLSFRSISPWMRRAHEGHALRESRSRSSPASVRQVANASDTGKMGQLLDTRPIAHSGQKTKKAMSDRRQLLANLSVKPKRSPSLFVRPHLFNPTKLYTGPDNSLERLKTSGLVSEGPSPTKVSMTRSFFTSSRPSDSLMHVFRQKHKDLNFPNSKTSVIKEKETSFTEIARAKELQMVQEKHERKLHGAALSENVSKGFNRSTKRSAFTHGNAEYKNGVKNNAETNQQKPSGTAHRYTSARLAAKSKSIHSGLWHRTAGLSSGNTRPRSPQGQQALDWDGSTNTQYMRGGATQGHEEKTLQQQRQRWQHSNVIPHSQLSKTSSPTRQLPTARAAKLSPDRKEQSTVSSKSEHSYQASPRKAPAGGASQAQAGPKPAAQQSEWSSRRARSTPTATRTSSNVSVLSRDRARKSGRSSPVAGEDRRRTLRESSLDDASAVTPIAPPRRKTDASTSRLDHAFRRATLTASASVMAAGRDRRVIKARTISSSPQDIPKALRDSRSPQREAAARLDAVTKALAPSAPGTKNRGSPVTGRSVERVVPSGDSIAAWGAKEDTDLISLDLENKVFCHFGSSDRLDSKTHVTSEDGKQETSSPETHTVKRKRKLVERMKKIRKKRRRKRGEETAGPTVEPQTSPNPPLELALNVGSDSGTKKTSPDASPKSTSSKKRSPEAEHTAGVTSVTIHKRSLSRSPPKMTRTLKLPRYRPVTRLTNKPTAMFPTASHIPLRMDSPDFLSNRKRLDLLSQYRRWREGMLDPDHPSKIPLSVGFRWTLNSAVVEEWALHCWEPDSGVYMDENGTWWSSASDPSPDLDLPTSILAEARASRITPVAARSSEPFHTYGHLSAGRQTENGDGGLVMRPVLQAKKVQIFDSLSYGRQDKLGCFNIGHSYLVLRLDPFYLFEVESIEALRLAILFTFCAEIIRREKTYLLRKLPGAKNQLKEAEVIRANQVSVHAVTQLTLTDRLLSCYNPTSYLDSNNNSSHTALEQSLRFAYGISYTGHTWNARRLQRHPASYSIIVPKNRIDRSRKCCSVACGPSERGAYLLLAVSTLLDLANSYVSPWFRGDVLWERNNNSGGSQLDARDLYTERSVTISSRTHSRLADSACGSRHLASTGHREMDTSGNWMKKLHRRRARRNMRPRPWKHPITINNNQSPEVISTHISQEMVASARFHGSKDILSIRNIGSSCKARMQTEPNDISQNTTCEFDRNSRKRTSYKPKPFPERFNSPDVAKQTVSPTEHGYTLSKKQNLNNLHGSTSNPQGSRFKPPQACRADEPATPQRMQPLGPYSHIKPKVNCGTPQRKAKRSPDPSGGRAEASVSRSWLDSFVEGYEQLRRGARFKYDGRDSQVQEQLARKVEQVVMKKARAIVKSYQKFLESQSNQFKPDTTNTAVFNATGNMDSNHHRELSKNSSLRNQTHTAQEITTTADTTKNVTGQGLLAEESQKQVHGTATPEQVQTSHGLGEDKRVRKTSSQHEQMFSIPESEDLDRSSQSFTMPSSIDGTSTDVPQLEAFELKEFSGHYEIRANWHEHIDKTTEKFNADRESSISAYKSIQSNIEEILEGKPLLKEFPTLRDSNSKGYDDKKKMPRKSKIPVLQKRTNLNRCEGNVGNGLNEERGTLNRNESKHRGNFKLDETSIEKFPTHSRLAGFKNQWSPHKPCKPKSTHSHIPIDAAAGDPWWKQSCAVHSKKKGGPLARVLNESFNQTSEQTGAEKGSKTDVHLLPSSTRKPLQHTERVDEKCRQEEKTKCKVNYRAGNFNGRFYSPLMKHDLRFDAKDPRKKNNINITQSKDSFQSLWDQSMDNNRDAKRHSSKPEDQDGNHKRLPSHHGSASSSWMSGSKGARTSNGGRAQCKVRKALIKLHVGASPSTQIQTCKQIATTHPHNVDDVFIEGKPERFEDNKDGRSLARQTPPYCGKEMSRASSPEKLHGEESGAYQSSLSTLRSISELPYNNPSPVAQASCAVALHSSPLSEMIISSSPSKAISCVGQSSPREKTGLMKEPRPAMPRPRVYDTLHERRGNAGPLRNINCSNKACRVSISEPNLTTESEKPSHSSLRRCFSYLNISSSLSKISFNTSISCQTCYFSGVSVHGDMYSLDKYEGSCSNKLNEKRRSIFTRLGAGDCINTGSAALTFRKRSDSSSAEFWSGVSSELYPPERLNTCFNNSPNNK